MNELASFAIVLLFGVAVFTICWKKNRQMASPAPVPPANASFTVEITMNGRDSDPFFPVQLPRTGKYSATLQYGTVNTTAKVTSIWLSADQGVSFTDSKDPVLCCEYHRVVDVDGEVYTHFQHKLQQLRMDVESTTPVFEIQCTSTDDYELVFSFTYHP